MGFRRIFRTVVLFGFTMSVAACQSSGSSSTSGGPTNPGQSGTSGISTPKQIQYQPAPASIGFAKDTTNAATKTLTRAGGTLKATGADGTVYTLGSKKGVSTLFSQK